MKTGADPHTDQSIKESLAFVEGSLAEQERVWQLKSRRPTDDYSALRCLWLLARARFSADPQTAARYRGRAQYHIIIHNMKKTP